MTQENNKMEMEKFLSKLNNDYQPGNGYLKRETGKYL